MQHQSLSLICRALSHLGTSAINTNKVSIVEVFIGGLVCRSTDRPDACAKAGANCTYMYLNLTIIKL